MCVGIGTRMDWHKSISVYASSSVPLHVSMALRAPLCATVFSKFTLKNGMRCKPGAH
jgi:hypothetical protein